MTFALARCRSRAARPACRAAAALSLGLLVWALAGCNFGKQVEIDNSTGAPQQMGSQAKLIAKSPQRVAVADVPEPIGFSLSESNSDAQLTGNSRYVNHVYTGRKAKDRVAAFYCEQMPTNHKWHQDAVRKNRGVWRLHFAKGSERCDITISENFWGTTTVYVEIYPVTTGGS